MSIANGQGTVPLQYLLTAERAVAVVAVKCIDNATQHFTLPGCNSNHTSAQVDAGKAAREYSDEVDPDMENHSYEEALDCLYSIYKVSELVHAPGRLLLTHSA